jgi:hypothetical protein
VVNESNIQSKPPSVVTPYCAAVYTFAINIINILIMETPLPNVIKRNACGSTHVSVLTKTALAARARGAES